jgi:hypothetical protein
MATRRLPPREPSAADITPDPLGREGLPKRLHRRPTRPWDKDIGKD